MVTGKAQPKVHVTQMLHKVLQEDGFDPQEFAQYFAGWKALEPAFEYADFYFGKDGYYNQPRRAGRLVLRHVHLPPANNTASAARWALAAKRQGKPVTRLSSMRLTPCMVFC